MKKLYNLYFIIFFTLIIVSCNRVLDKSQITGNWTIDPKGFELELGEDIPIELKLLLKTNLLDIYTEIDPGLIIEFEEEGTVSVKKDQVNISDLMLFISFTNKWDIDKNQLIIISELKNKRFQLGLDVTEIHRDKMILNLSVESLIEQMKKQDFENINDLFYFIELFPFYDISSKLKGTSITMALNRE